MEKERDVRPGDKHPVVQNLRYFLRDYLNSSPQHNLFSFASKLDISYNELGRYLRGECKPRRKTAEKFARLFGVSLDYIMMENFDYIAYPFEKESAPKRSGSHITKRAMREGYDTMINEISCLVKERDIEYGAEILDIVRRHKKEI